MIIQRWQNLLLFIALLLMCVFFFTPYATVAVQGGVEEIYAYSAPVFLTLNLVIFVMLIIAIAFFKNLKKQRTVTATTILLLVASVASAIIMACNASPEAQLVWLGGVSMPVLAVLCCAVAYVCMGKDREEAAQLRPSPLKMYPDFPRLPVSAIAGDVNASLKISPRLVVTAPPGSGKSTLLPLTILEALPEGKIVMLEPRRAAARQIAMRMAQMLGQKPGETVGYRMRFESKVSAATRIEVVTEGVMERMLIDDPTLDGVAVVIFDEFHERSLTADLTLALTREAQSVLRPDLGIVLMSATMDADALCRVLDAPLIEAKGKLYDVELLYGDDIDMHDCVPAVVSAVRKAYREQPGNILVFLPGAGEIAACAEALADLPDALLMPLHGMLPPAEQYRAIEYNPQDMRKIVLATPIAETSLTIEGIRTVVDSGLCRAVRYDPSTRLSQLVTERISLDMARQRAGRAGRLCEGVCYRLWSKAAEHRMRENRTPEIADADLSAMMLSLAAWGGGEVENLPWLTPPSPGHIAEAKRLLRPLAL